MNEKEWLTIRQAADLYQQSEKTIRRRIADGSIEARRFGPRAIRIKAASLDRFGRTLQYVEGAR